MSSGEKPPEDAVFVALAGQHALLRVEGRGTFKISTSLKQFADSVSHKKIPLILADMSGCIGMDSTFMGVLAGVATRMKSYDGRVVLVNCSPRTRGLLATLGLDRLIGAYETGQTPAEFANLLTGRASSGEQLATASARDTLTVQTMLDAHQHLVDLVPMNMPQFKDVLVYLREEISRKAGADAGPA